MTATEIVFWMRQTSGAEIAPELIDRELLDWWRKDPNSHLLGQQSILAQPLLPAFGVVGRLSGRELQAMRTDLPVELEIGHLPLEAPLSLPLICGS